MCANVRQPVDAYATIVHLNQGSDWQLRKPVDDLGIAKASGGIDGAIGNGGLEFDEARKHAPN